MNIDTLKKLQFLKHGNAIKLQESPKAPIKSKAAGHRIYDENGNTVLVPKDITEDQAYGREPFEVNGKKYYLNGDSKTCQSEKAVKSRLAKEKIKSASTGSTLDNIKSLLFKGTTINQQGKSYFKSGTINELGVEEPIKKDEKVDDSEIKDDTEMPDETSVSGYEGFHLLGDSPVVASYDNLTINTPTVESPEIKTVTNATALVSNDNSATRFKSLEGAPKVIAVNLAGMKDSNNNRIFSDKVIAAILGNAYLESSFNEKASGDNGHSYGYWQWYDSRKDALFKHAGTNTPGIMLQIYYLVDDLKGNYKHVLDKMNKASSVDEATKIFMELYENPAKATANLARRQNYARQAYGA